MKLQKGDVFRIDGHEYAVFYVSADILGMIRTDVAEFQNFDTNDFLKKVTDGVYEAVPVEADVACPTLPDSELERVILLSQVMDNLIEAQYPDWQRMVDPVANRNVTEAATKAGYTVKPFKRLFYRYLRAGCNMSSLVDNRRLKLANMQKKQQSTGLIEREPQVLTHHKYAKGFFLHYADDVYR